MDTPEDPKVLMERRPGALTTIAMNLVPPVAIVIARPLALAVADRPVLRMDANVVRGFVGSLTLSATASSGLPVSYEASGACSIAGNSAMPAHAGTCTITARQAGDATFNPAPDVVRTFTITGEQLFLPLLSR